MEGTTPLKLSFIIPLSQSLHGSVKSVKEQLKRKSNHTVQLYHTFPACKVETAETLTQGGNIGLHKALYISLLLKMNI